MSILGGIYPEPDKVVKKSSVHRKYDSGELDVFEAAHYFSGINNENSNSSMSTRKLIMREDSDHDRRQQLGGGRISVDMAPMTMRHALLASHHYHQMCDSNKQRNITKEKTKQKQPSSPGGKLASFLNSLFTRQTLLRDTHTTEKKKKKSSSSSSAAAAVAQTIKDEEESPGGTGRWRRRRSSISHFRSTSTSNSASSAAGIIEYSKSMFSSSSSSVGGFRTPPPYVNTTSYKDNIRTNNYSDRKQLVPSTNLSKYGTTKTSISRSSTVNNFDWLDEKLIKFTSNELSSTKSKQNNSNHDSCAKARSTCSSSSRVMDRYRGATAADDQDAEKKEIIRRFNQVDDEGEDSDSSSDLFELQLNNYDHLGSGYCSSGLPVYETTHMDSIKRSSVTPIANGPLKN